ncbi:MAG: c-type cytochrome [Oleiphilaceae bacterium]|nr:c-type cytochrome [Oleiphilaceae bacterium]
MKKVLLSVLVVAGMMGTTHAFAELQGDPAAGEQKTAACAGCHGADGNSAVGNFPKLAGQGAPYLIKQLNDVQSGERKIVEMTGILDGMSQQDFADIAAFYASKNISIGQANPDLVSEGELIYRAGIPAKGVPACTACHGPAGAGIDLAKFPALGGQHTDYTVKQLEMFRSGERANDGDARVMRSIAARLSDREIEAVSSYISGLH